MKSWGRKLRTIKDRWVQRTQDGYHLFSSDTGDEWVALDIETTHLDVSKACILSIGAVTIKAQTIKTSHCLDIKVKPPDELPSDTVKVHMLRKVDLQQGLTIEDAIAKLLNFVGDRPLVGYNIDYDLSVLDKWMLPKWGYGITNKSTDVLSLYRQRLANQAVVESNMRLSFEDLSEQLNIPIISRHDALGDAITAALMFVKLNSPS